jgi:sugar/nucleoside kinase (ribokinase family)
MSIDYLLIGHMTADLTPEGRTAGGTVSFAARTVHSFGLHVGLLTSTADGEPLLESLSPYAEVVCIPSHDATTTYENLYTKTGRVQYVRGVALHLTPDMLPEDWKNVPLVHLAPIANEVSPEFAHRFPNAITLATLQGWLRRWDSEGRVGLNRWYDSTALSKLDAVVLSGEDIPGAPDIEESLVQDCAHVFMTQAELGGIHYDHGVPHPYATPQVEVVNPTGAGDIFAAALLCAYQRLQNWDRAAVVAARLGAISVTRVGLDSAPTPAEVEAAFVGV